MVPYGWDCVILFRGGSDTEVSGSLEIVLVIFK